MLGPGRPGAGDGGQVVGEDAPADPAAEAGLALVAAAAEVAAALERADAPLGARAEAQRPPVPALALVPAPPSVLGARLGQRHAPDAPALGEGLVRRRVQAAVAGEQVGRMAEQPLVREEAPLDLPRIGRVAREHRVAADDAAV